MCSEATGITQQGRWLNETFLYSVLRILCTFGHKVLSALLDTMGAEGGPLPPQS